MQLTKKPGPKQAAAPKPRTSPIIPDVGLVLLDSALKPIAFDRGAAAILNHPLQPGVKLDGSCPIPEEVLEVLCNRKPTQLSSVKTIFRRGKSDYICRVYLVEPHNGSLAQPIMALHLEKDGSITNSVHEVSAKYHLTGREQEALKGISLGLTNKDLAKRMSISPNTVRAFLRLIMIKMGVTTRSAIVAKILQDREIFQDGMALSSAASTDKKLAG